MELHEFFARVVVRHGWLLVATVALGVVGAAVFAFASSAKYTATGRLQAASTAPSSETEAAAVSDRVKGIATSDQVLTQAIAAAKLDRTARLVEPEVSVTRIGSSGVVDISVTDADPHVAVSLAAALTRGVAQWDDRLPHDVVNPLLSDIDALTKTLQQSHGFLQQDAGVSNTLADLQAARQQLMTDQASDANTAIVSMPATARASARNLPLVLAIVVLLGLVVGLLLSALHESLYPSFANATSVARSLKVPVLGRLNAGRLGASQVPTTVLTAIAARARNEGVRRVAVTGAVPASEMVAFRRRLAQALADPWYRLPAPLPSVNGHGSHAADATKSAASWRSESVVAVREQRAAALEREPAEANPAAGSLEMVVEPSCYPFDRHDTGVVVVATRFMPVSVVEEVHNACQVIASPILGVVDATATRMPESEPLVPDDGGRT